MGPAKSVVAAIAGLGLGLFCVWLSIGEAPTGADAQWTEPDSGEETPHDASDAGSASDVNDSGGEAPSDELAVVTVVEQIQENAEEPPPEPQIAGVNEGVDEAEPVVVDEPRVANSDLRLRRGRLAYLRCGDLDMTGRCPRDQEMEAEAWRVLEALTTCGRLQSGGTGDVRFRLGSGPTEARFREHGDRPIAADDLVACLGDSIGSVRTTMPADGIVVSFRFSLE